MGIPNQPADSFRVTVDGDTDSHPIDFTKSATNKLPVSIRFLGEDTAELHVPDANGYFHGQGKPGQYGKAVLTEILSTASNVEVVPSPGDPIDGYGRVLGTVYARVTQDGILKRINVNQEMVARGAGDMYFIYGKDFDRAVFDQFSAASRAAIVQKKGIYGPDNFLEERPYIFRAKIQGRTVERYCASLTTGLVYAPTQVEKVIPIWDRLWINKETLPEAMQKLKLTYAPGAVPALPALPAPSAPKALAPVGAR
jgi:endonuclease YncB( thermonuclease family)